MQIYKKFGFEKYLALSAFNIRKHNVKNLQFGIQKNTKILQNNKGE